MKILSVQQPCARDLVSGEQTDEGRSWGTPYRGQLLIHAGKTSTRLSRDDSSTGLYFGSVIGLVDLVDCVGKTGQGFAWVVVNPRRLETPIPLRGRLGLWTAEPDLIEAVRGQLGHAADAVAPPVPKRPPALVMAKTGDDHYKTGRSLLAAVKQATAGNRKKALAVTARVPTLVELPPWAIKKILVGMGRDVTAISKLEREALLVDLLAMTVGRLAQLEAVLVG